MLNSSDLLQIKKKGISPAQIEEQLNSFVHGFPFLEIRSGATPEKGILLMSNEEIQKYLNQWDDYLKSNGQILKFVPASGAASRMFKDLFEFLDGAENEPTKNAELQFFADINKFAFYEELNRVCLELNAMSISELIAENKHKTVVDNLLSKSGLNYGSLPKGLLLFHSYTDEKRTPFQEHLVEGAMYASNSESKVNIHFTVSNEHRLLFENHCKNILNQYEKKFNKKYNISFSEQKPSTDTLAADENNQAFRENGEMVFRPGGHGALIENLNDLDADIIFIKNIDNVVPDSLKNSTIIYKKVIAGLLVKLQEQSFGYLTELEKNDISDEKIKEIAFFCTHKLNNHHSDIESLTKNDLVKYLYGKLNRPMRICGMVKNTGEPGGGPFLTLNQDGTVSPQILESSQIDLSNPAEKEKMMHSTHFNPVDLVCAVKNFKGEKFNLIKFVDKHTGFISLKSKNGKELKALELPGLWNGAMSDWNTIFVEVPIETFNPVKTVNDLLRPEHQ